MATPTMYIETSVWGSLAPRQPPDRKRIVQQLLSLLDGVHAICVISDAILEEIDLAPPATAAPIRRRLEAMRPMAYPISEAVEKLASAYITAGVLPARRVADAVHVAVSTCFGIDYLASWNHRHMTRPLKKLQYESVNRLNGYLKTPLICNPLEACDELQTR